MSLTMPRPLATLAFLMAWLAPWRPAFPARAARSGLTFFVHHRDAIGRHIAKYGTHEPLVTRWLADYLAAAEPGIAIDIGANLGWHAVHIARQPNVEYLIAFEPDPFNAWLLDRNLAANGVENVIVDNRAVGDKPGRATLHRYKSSNFGRHSLTADYGFGSRAVALTDLDGAVAGLGLADRRVAIIKIDVEGFEPAVIAGAPKTLARTDAIIMEFSPDLSAAGGLSTPAMADVLAAAGFSPFLLRSDGGTVPATLEDLRGSGGSFDVIWLRSDRISPAIERAMNIKERGAASAGDIHELNKQVVSDRA